MTVTWSQCTNPIAKIETFCKAESITGVLTSRRMTGRLRPDKDLPKLEKGNFLGREAVLRQREAGLKRRLAVLR